MSWNIAVARRDDAVEISRLISQVAHQTYAAIAHPESIEAWLAANYSPQAIERLIEATIYLVARCGNGELAGAAMVRRLDSRTAYLSGLYCRVPRKGVGAALLDARLEVAKRWGVEQVYAHTFAGNPAITALLRSRGFEFGGTDKHASPLAPLELWVLILTD